MTDFANLTIEWGTTPDSITLLELMKQQLDITDASMDAELSMYLDMAGNAAERYIDNIIEQREVIERFPIVSDPIALRYYPIQTLVLVEIDSVDKTTDYQLFYQSGIGWSVKNVSGCDKGTKFEQMDVTYTAGFSPLPAELGFAIVQSALSYETGASGGSIRRESVVGVGSIEYATDEASGAAIRVGQIPASAVAVLDAYKRLYA